MEPILRSEGIRRRFGALEVLRGVSLEVMSGEVVSIVGASGAGKSTLLHILGTLDTADEGKLRLLDKEVTQMSSANLAQLRNQHLGFVFQFHNLMPEFTAIENAAMPAYLAGTSKREAHEKAESLLAKLGLKERMHHQPSQLSGGEQQRIAVARALVNEPKLVLADEPSGNLDSKHAAQLHDIFFTLRQEMGFSFIIVTHNLELAAMADRKLEMQDGLLIN